MGLWRKRKKTLSYLYNFIIIILMVLKFSKTKYTNQSTKKKSPKQHSSESWVVVVVEFGQDFD